MNPKKIEELLEAIDLKQKLMDKINELKENVKNDCGGNCRYYNRYNEYSSGSYYDSPSFHIYMKCSLCGKYECIERG